MKVLISEPELRQREGLAQALTEHGIEVLAAPSGRSAVVTALAEPPDVLLTCWLLADPFHGLHLAAALRSRLPRLQAVLWTQAATPDIGYYALRVGVSDVIAADVSPGRIVLAVQTAAGAPRPPGIAMPYPQSFLDSVLAGERPGDASRWPLPGQALVVDPSDAFRRQAVAELERAGCVTHSADQAGLAVELLERDPGIGVVVVDWEEPKEAALLARRLRRRRPGLIVVAEARHDRFHGTAPAGADVFLIKPWRVEELASRVLAVAGGS
jgi:DNA-binding response OmpR family regulator